MSRKERVGSIPINSATIYKDFHRRPFSNGHSDKVDVALFLNGRRTLYLVDGKEGGHGEKTPMDHAFERISEEHGRSMTESATSKNVIWGGRYKGDIYGAKAIKGTALYQNPCFQKNEYVPKGVITLGLMDGCMIERVRTASRYMRINGLPTERPSAVKTLKEILTYASSGHFLRQNIDTWKRDRISFHGSVETPTPWDQKIIGYLSETDYVALERDVQVDERLSDLKHFSHPEAFMKPIFRWLKVATEYRRGGLISGTPKPDMYKPTPQHIIEYFINYLPGQMGTYLGRLHKIGLAHTFPHSQNWSVVGTLYDLDSVFGRVLFTSDRTPGWRDHIEDIFYSLDALSDTLNSVNACSHFFFSSEVGLFTTATEEFLKNYIQERFGELRGISRKLFRFQTSWIKDRNVSEHLEKAWKRLD